MAQHMSLNRVSIIPFGDGIRVYHGVLEAPDGTKRDVKVQLEKGEDLADALNSACAEVAEEIGYLYDPKVSLANAQMLVRELAKTEQRQRAESERLQAKLDKKTQ